MNEPADDTPASMDALPRHTTPTWEVELLISGVAVFAMLQLPGWLDDRWFALGPRLDTSWLKPLMFIYIYCKSGALLLAVTFVLHLLLRARWIALVGMHSVYPAGIDWNRLPMGPVQREVEQRRYGNAEATIERADNGATIVFAIGVMMASLLLVISVVLLAVYAAAHWVAARMGLEIDAANAWLLIIAIVLAPMPLATRFDRSFGSRLATGSAGRSFLARVFSTYGRLGFGQGANPAIALLSSRGSRIRTTLVMVSIMVVTVLTAITGYRFGNDPSQLGSYALFPRMETGSPHVFDTTHYDDTRNADRDVAAPFIQSAVVTGPYVRLVIPYRPTRDEPALRRSCKGIGGETAQGSAIRFACLTRLHAVMLDGARLPVDFAVGTDARTDRPALVAMIDVRALAVGRHELVVEGPPLPGDVDAKSTVDRIQFWR